MSVEVKAPLPVPTSHPSSISAALLELHYVCLLQAKTFRLISPKGAVLSSIGGRVELKELLDMADEAGYSGRILSLSWKEQGEPESVIGGYANREQEGGRKVCFSSLLLCIS